MIFNYDDFVKELLEVGFSMGGGNSEGIYSIIPWTWNESPPYETPVRWHTGDAETDPWEWRIRVLEERDDIAYGKFFFKKSGFITKEWYPYFLAARRGGTDFEEAYADGTISHSAKRIYDIVKAHERLPLEEIKRLAGFSKDDKSAFDRALTELQMKMFLTMCGRRQNTNWASTVFCTTEIFFGEEVFEQAAKISSLDAKNKITAQVLKINPTAQEKKILKFLI